MSAPRRRLQSYDHRLRELVRETGDIAIATELGVPRSTALGWLRCVPREVVSAEVLGLNTQALRQEVLRLRRRVRVLAAVMRILLAVLRVSGFRLDRRRVTSSKQRRLLLRTIDSAERVLPRRAILRILRISAARVSAWRHAEVGCDLDDRPGCPRTASNRLTAREVMTMKDMVTSLDHRHVPTGTLAILAQRLGKVFASPTTWYRLVRQRGWRRPRRRIHPEKPKVGLRATKPDAAWHIDATIIKLLDGTKAYLHAVIDNYSRRILAWHVADRLRPDSTLAVLLAAIRGAGQPDVRPDLIADGGVENVNGVVDELIHAGLLRRLLALTELRFSNSMIEAWWRQLKSQWLHLNSLDNLATLRRLVAFYVRAHNEQLPHSAFRGQTPDEMYFGGAEHVPGQLEQARRAAREARLAANRTLSCPSCPVSACPEKAAA